MNDAMIEDIAWFEELKTVSGNAFGYGVFSEKVMVLKVKIDGKWCTVPTIPLNYAVNFKRLIGQRIIDFNKGE